MIEQSWKGKFRQSVPDSNLGTNSRKFSLLAARLRDEVRIAGGETNSVNKQPEPRDEKYKDAILTIPNLICIGRALGSIGLVWIAIQGWPYWFAGCYAVLNLSDFVDGKPARWLKQRSDLGARLDSFADSILYGALIIGATILSWEMLQHELVWLSIGIASYLMTTGYGLLKFRRIPSYHTFGAKKTQWLALAAGISLILGWSVWPMRICVVAVVLTNLEAMAITYVLKEWRADVLTLFYVWPTDRMKLQQNQIETLDDPVQ